MFRCAAILQVSSTVLVQITGNQRNLHLEGIRDMWTRVEEIVCPVIAFLMRTKEYRKAVNGYLLANGTKAGAGKAIKSYLKDLWSAFILVVSIVRRSCKLAEES